MFKPNGFLYDHRREGKENKKAKSLVKLPLGIEAVARRGLSAKMRALGKSGGDVEWRKDWPGFFRLMADF